MESGTAEVRCTFRRALHLGRNPLSIPRPICYTIRHNP
jgi:hypothetical protein